MEKKTWQRPELVILVHAQPEQSLILYCKSGPAGQTSPNDFGGACIAPGIALCTTCHALNPS